LKSFGDLLWQDFNATNNQITTQSVTVPSQPAGTIVNVTVTALSVYGETLVVSTLAMFRSSSVNAYNSSLSVTPSNGIAVSNQPIVASIALAGDTSNCSDTVTFALNNKTEAVTKPNALMWNTSISNQGNYTISATYTNGLGTFVIPGQLVNEMFYWGRVCEIKFFRFP
jgi:hypothetical protein